MSLIASVSNGSVCSATAGPAVYLCSRGDDCQGEEALAVGTVLHRRLLSGRVAWAKLSQVSDCLLNPRHLIAHLCKLHCKPRGPQAFGTFGGAAQRSPTTHTPAERRAPAGSPAVDSRLPRRLPQMKKDEEQGYSYGYTASSPQSTPYASGYGYNAVRIASHGPCLRS